VTPSDLKGLHVLAVDDNATHRRIITGLLTDCQMKPTCVESGQQALDALKAARVAGEPYSVALIDAQIPDIDGYELAKKIKSDVQLSGTAVVLLLSPGSAERLSETIDGRIAGKLMKP